jgi:hypothetical protein
MKTSSIKSTLILMAVLPSGQWLYAQQPEMQYLRPNDKAGLNMFETPKDNDEPFNGLRVRVGGDFAIQFQGLSQSNDLTVGDTLIELANNFNLPSANLNLDVQLADGMRIHLRTYLSSRHHSEAWVKGGYVQIDKLDFVKEGFLSGVMDLTTLRFGMDEMNYGDSVDWFYIQIYAKRHSHCLFYANHSPEFFWWTNTKIGEVEF